MFYICLLNKIITDAELGMSAVERMYEYIDKNELESDWDKPTPSDILTKQMNLHQK